MECVVFAGSLFFVDTSMPIVGSRPYSVVYIIINGLCTRPAGRASFPIRDK